MLRIASIDRHHTLVNGFCACACPCLYAYANGPVSNWATPKRKCKFVLATSISLNCSFTIRKRHIIRISLSCAFVSANANVVVKTRHKINLPRWESKVNNSDLSGHLWSVMWVWKLCGDVKLEVIMVRNDRVSEFDDSAAWLLKGLGEEKKAKISNCVELHTNHEKKEKQKQKLTTLNPNPYILGLNFAHC